MKLIRNVVCILTILIDITPYFSTPILPIGDATLYSVGAEYQASSKQVFSLALATMKSTYSMPGNTTELGNSEDPTKLIYNPYSGTDITASVNVVLFEASYRFWF